MKKNFISAILFTIFLTPAASLASQTNMATYNANGIRFEYPINLSTAYATLNAVNTYVKKLGNTKVDSNGCYPLENVIKLLNLDDDQDQTQLITINSIPFCFTLGKSVGAGQLTLNYIYTAVQNKSAYIIDYSVRASNGCMGYEGKEYTDCMNAQKNFDINIVKPIQDSIATFGFVS